MHELAAYRAGARTGLRRAGWLAAPSVKLNLAALRMLFDWLVGGARHAHEGLIRPRAGGHGIRLHEKGCKLHEMPCHHHLDEYLHAYIGPDPDRLSLFPGRRHA